MRENPKKLYRFTNQHLVFEKINARLNGIKHFVYGFCDLEVRPRLMFDLVVAHAFEHGSIPRDNEQKRNVARKYYEEIRESEARREDGKAMIPFDAMPVENRLIYDNAVHEWCKVLKEYKPSLVNKENFESLPGWEEDLKRTQIASQSSKSSSERKKLDFVK